MMAFEIIEKARADHSSPEAFIHLAKRNLGVSAKTGLRVNERVVIEVDREKKLIRLVRTKSSWAFRIVPWGKNGQSIVMHPSYIKKLSMPLGHYILKKKSGAAFTFSKV